MKTSLCKSALDVGIFSEITFESFISLETEPQNDALRTNKHHFDTSTVFVNLVNPLEISQETYIADKQRTLASVFSSDTGEST